MLAEYLQHGFRMHHPVERRLHDERYVAGHWKHEAGDEAHVMIKRQPAVNPVGRAVNLQRLRKMGQLTQYGSVGQGHTLLQSGRARRMLDERNAIALTRKRRDFFFAPAAIADSKQLRLLAQRHVPEHFIRKLFVNDDNLGVEVCRHSCHSEAVLGWLDLVIGVGDKCWHRAEHHRSNEDGHRQNALRHDDDHAIPTGHAISAEHCGLQTGAAAEFSKGDCFLFVFVDPGRDERTLAGSRLKRFDEIAVSDHASV